MPASQTLQRVCVTSVPNSCSLAVVLAPVLEGGSRLAYRGANVPRTLSDAAHLLCECCPAVVDIPTDDNLHLTDAWLDGVLTARCPLHRARNGEQG